MVFPPLPEPESPISNSPPSVARHRTRSVDPYRDLDVIDAHAPRTNQAIIGSLAVVALVTGWTPLVAGLALLAATTGLCVGCVIYPRLWGCATCAANLQPEAPA